ncbi:lysophospholipase L1-like esterase [Dysgonomonas alginatilytica]|uniref:Lysophospholipase L1-like esterase n=1 Tax=Dysgonomonas alginatilytica TaxID=1605892 RepID=A0A2V3PL28_9BACT|nr:SGNH/GDSL hydrolase family protein [Dysgonomonas alginatilytica]PXV60172.1 lysophospholipase L1-like esterase [Dysgonomonas alginatilytica]
MRGSFYYSTAGANPIGGGLIGPTGSAPTSDLCVGITIVKSMSDGDRQVNYIALGDSITNGQGAAIPYPRLLSLSLRGTFTNLGQNGLSTTGTGSNYLDSKVALVPAGFKGLITLMIGTNDAGNNLTLGDAAVTLTKDFANLSKSNFADAFRWNLETLITKCPDAVIVVVLSIKFADAAHDATLEKYREVQRIISNHFAVPCLEIYKTCKITFITFPTLMADNTHPNDAGHVEINRVLKPQINLLL